MTFTTSCFVRVENYGQRHSTIDYCANTLQRDGGFVEKADAIIGEYVLCYEDMTYCCSAEEVDDFRDHCIDCGEDTDLFLALAAMRDDTDDRQWFTDGVDWGIFHQANPEDKLDVDGISFPYLPHPGYNIDNFRKATAAEIVKHYKNKR